jgi:glycosyltransferase involved in cell wall biosynthesis
MNNPLISVIIPTHSRSIYLKRALDSINLQQHRNRIEVILISDEIDTHTDSVAHDGLNGSDIYIRRNGEKGPAQSRNIGLNLASGDYVMFLDDDDAWDPDFTKNLFFHNLIQHNDIRYMDCLIIKETRTKLGPIKLSETVLTTNNLLNQNIYVKNQVHMSCFIFNRNILKNLYFDNKLRAYEDWDFLLSVIDRKMPLHLPVLCSHVYEVDDHTTDRRGSSTQATDFNAVLDYLKIYRDHVVNSDEIKLSRQALLKSVGLEIDKNLL